MQDKSTTDSRPTARMESGKIALGAALAGAILFSGVQRLLLNFRAGHMDEYDYLFVGKVLLQNMEWPTYTYIFGANISWYFYGYADQWLGGLSGARAASGLLGMVSLIGVYHIAKAVWHCKKIAWIAVLLMAIQSSHIFTSKIATYDSVSFTLFTLALAPLFIASGAGHDRPSARNGLLLLLIGSLLLLGAVLTKYTTVAYVPFIALFLLVVSMRSGIIFSIIVSTGVAAFVLTHKADLIVLYNVQISGVHGANATYREIVSRTLNGTWLLLLPASLAALHAHSNKLADSRPLKTVLWLMFFATPLILYHWQGRNLISLYKHLTYANLFFSIAAAWLIVLMIETKPSRTSRIFLYGRQILAALTMAYVAVNYSQLKATEHGFPDMQALLDHLNTTPAATGGILSEDPYLFRYLEYAEIEQHEIRETTWLDNDQDGIYSLQDVNDAVWDRKFEMVLLTDAIHPQRNDTLRAILSQRGYVQVFNQPYNLSSVMTTHTEGEISLYKRGAQIATINQ